MLAHYLSGRFGPGQAAGAEWRTLYDLCAAQRLMQALGAYGNLGLNRGHPHFLKYIPIALPLLREVLGELENPGLASLVAALEECAAQIRPGALAGSAAA